MTVDQRARSASAAVHEAVASVAIPELVPWSGRSSVRRGLLGAGTAASALAAALLAFSLATSPGAPTPAAGTPSVDVERPTLPADPGRPVTTEASKGSDANSPSAGDSADSPRTLDDGATDASRPERGTTSPTSAPTDSCTPVVTDLRGDANNPAIDIVEGRLHHDAGARSLTVEMVMDDIPEELLSPDDALNYVFEFVLDGTPYMAVAYVGASPHNPGGGAYFAVERDDRTAPSGWPDVELRRKVILEAPGTIDGTTDTVRLEIEIPAFNRGERRAAQEEGLPPASELGIGSTLVHNNVNAWDGGAYSPSRDMTDGRRCPFVVD